MQKNEHSYGIIPLKLLDKQCKVLLIRHGHGHWSFPKGHKERGETSYSAACRELKEETGLEIRCLLETPEIKEDYIFTRMGAKVSKRVLFFIAFVHGRVVLQKEEVTAYKWLPFDEAEKLLTFPESKRLCRHVKEIILSSPNF